MSRMREVTIKSNTTTTTDHERNLDALLEDLHTTVSRSNSSSNLNGGTVTTGYRSMRRTTSDGTPEGTRSEYHVEYLNPANSTQLVSESSYHSGNLNEHSSSERANANRSITESYKYSSEMSGGDSRMKKNISELDSLLDDLNVAQKKSFSSNSAVTTSGFDTGLLEPVSSTPHSTRAYEKRYREEKTVRRERSSSPRRELVFTGPRSRDPSPIDYHTSYEQREQTPTVQQFYRYEKTTSTRSTAPVVTTEVLGGNDSSRLYTSESPLAIKHRSPSPSGPQHSQTDGYGKTSSYNYSSSTSRETRSDNRTTSPHRSQSPVSFQQPPQPSLNRNRSFRDQSPPPPPRSHSPQRFSPSDPSHRSPYTPAQQSTISSYKYSSNTTSSTNYRDDSLTRPRPFPTDPPQEQQPPKQLDELLATLSDSDTTDRYLESREISRHHQQTTVNHHSQRSQNDLQKPVPVAPPPPKIPEPQKYQEEVREKSVRKELARQKDETQPLSGPPVYYPPGVELFTKKEEEAMMQQRSGGMFKSKAKYEYEAKSKSKSKESSGKVVVPVCLPLCCGAPCSIM